MPVSPSSAKKHFRRRPKEMSLQITSMIDIFTILLVFLLKSFSTEGHLVNIAKEIKLPASSAVESVHPGISVAFSGESLYFESELIVGDVKSVIASDEMLIEPLYAALKQNADKIKAVAEKNPSMVFTGEIVLQGDREIPFRLLKKIIYTAGQAEYVNQTLAVFQKGPEGG